MNVLHKIWEILRDFTMFVYQIGLFLYKLGAGVLAVLLMLTWALCQLVICIANFLTWAADNFETVAGGSPIYAAFPGGMTASVEFANAIFPVQECFDAFSFLAALWLLVATVRIAKSLVPGWS